MKAIHRFAALAVLLVFSLLAAGCGSDSVEASAETEPSTTTAAVEDDEDSSASEGSDSPTTEATTTTEAVAPTFEGELIGLFEITAADCSSADSVGGSYFRMAQIGASLEDGPFVPNADSSCADLTITPLTPGSDGGLRTGAHQPAPDPPFDEKGSGLADRITEPVTFFGISFAMATSEDAPVPAISATAGNLDGDLSAVAAYYAALVFNQGAPKPDGSTPGLTFDSPTGTIDPETGEFVLEWASQIVGGPFAEFTGIWHLEGTFVPA